MEILTYEAKEQTMVQEKEAKTISILINSIYFFIECVFILDFPDHYRLVVLQHGRVLKDARYKTLRGAKIAFSNAYRKKAWKEGMKPQWSHFYDPDKPWLDKKIKDIRAV
ncbi:MAG: hypothetical protein JSV88_32725 [Candidatus Aminicenantes bacterium]|nr:MAG: hypothetical protein JSV88_32725 [Candidatus Aminicenantes bacterium]